MGKTTYPFEIHVTVRSPDLDKFRQACVEIRVKPIVLDLQDREGVSVLTDVMTSGRYEGTDAGAAYRAGLTAYDMIASGFNVVRTKVETVPWHPMAPSLENGLPMPAGSYFESHIQVTTKEDRLPDLRCWAKLLKAHCSQNVFKRNGENAIVMLTLREHEGTAESFQRDVQAAVFTLKASQYDVTKHEVEFCVYDSKQDHDKEWISPG